MTTTTDSKTARDYIASRAGVEKVRVTSGEVHAYGLMPNSTTTGWYLAGYVAELAVQARAEADAR